MEIDKHPIENSPKIDWIDLKSAGNRQEYRLETDPDPKKSRHRENIRTETLCIIVGMKNPAALTATIFVTISVFASRGAETMLKHSNQQVGAPAALKNTTPSLRNTRGLQCSHTILRPKTLKIW